MVGSSIFREQARLDVLQTAASLQTGKQLQGNTRTTGQPSGQILGFYSERTVQSKVVMGQMKLGCYDIAIPGLRPGWGDHVTQAWSVGTT